MATDEHQSIDESFLQELDVFREELARGYKRTNPELDGAALTEVTQRTLDRLVFMRFLEDKLIESDQLIEDLHRKGKSWDNFIATSRRLDAFTTASSLKSTACSIATSSRLTKSLDRSEQSTEGEESER